MAIKVNLPAQTHFPSKNFQEKVGQITVSFITKQLQYLKSITIMPIKSIFSSSTDPWKTGHLHYKKVKLILYLYDAI
jgi:hypothetical protein